MTATYSALRAHLARTAEQHWGVLRLIAPHPDPRCVAAEMVATHATHLVQLPALWTALQIQEAIADGQAQSRRQIAELATGGGTAAEIRDLARAIGTLDQVARGWCRHAYGGHQAARPREGA